jgi:hypothetical protein
MDSVVFYGLPCFLLHMHEGCHVGKMQVSAIAKSAITANDLPDASPRASSNDLFS